MKHPPRSFEPSPPPELVDELALAHLAAARASSVIVGWWGNDPEVYLKGDINPVSEADLGAERVITALIEARFPDDTVIAEEGSGSEGISARTWYIDPLDGTTNFSHGFPHFCVSIASSDADGGRVAVIAEPLRGWVFSATRGGGAWLDGPFGRRRLRVSAAERLDRALLATGFPYDRHTRRDNNSHRFTHALRKAQGLRRAGAAALDLVYVAAGWLDGFWEDHLSPWDHAAGALLVTEAGGRVTDFAGGPVDWSRGALVASNEALHGALIEMIANADAAFGREEGA